MYETIFDARNSDVSALSVVDSEGAIRPMLVGTIAQLSTDLFEIALQMKDKVTELCCTFFSANKTREAMPKGRYT